jgi:hypothetical protein
VTVEPQVVLVVAPVVVILVQLVKWMGLPDRYGPFAVMVASALSVALWCWSNGHYSQALAWELFTAWLTIAAAAGGIYGFTRAKENFTAFRSQKE